ncbi:hypothetical protein IFO69_13360 [Echinicola sp. CAU 1574]|uniref:Histidine Kinase domain-containing protein n=1 Tax=Echinicola arenosa TaxID=2774144 RepID=A0ABR9AQ61_9BACT|nr:hypothetical protein [Echinicola arenosa]MBD8489739.1 hypothetical protein [Echinicola arenosa]
MAKNKYDFIKELLDDKKLNQSQRERILALASKEISLEGSLEERVQKIEEIIYNQSNETRVLQTEKLSKSEGLSLPKYIDPYHLYKFLFEYNQNPVLRSTCHDIDSEELKKINEYCESESYDFKKHRKNIIEAFIEHEKKFFAPGKAKALIRGYLTGKDYKGNPLKKGWSFTDEIKINWSSDKLFEWVTKNPNTPPNLNENIAADQEIELFNIEPQIDSPITNEPIQSFTQLVLHFKNLFHLKSGSQGLRAILERVNSMEKWNEKVEFDIPNKDFPNNLEHFTDVDKLVTAYDSLLRLIIQQHQRDERPKVKLRLYQESQKVYLSIHHLNGQYNKTVQNCIDRPHGRDYKNLISLKINGLCNLYLKADFGNQEFATINLWNGKELEAQKLNRFIGVEHILEFPKIKES